MAALSAQNRELPRVCVIGAGPSGITAAKRLAEYGIPFDCYEASDEVGGNWYYKNPNGMSACYQSLHIDTSKFRLQFEDFPAPEEWPDFPHHSQLHRYFQDYVDHFGLRDRILFDNKVISAERGDDGLWTVTTDQGCVETYDALIVANGHHWDPRTPDYPGEFDGTLIHSHAYNDPFDPVDMRGKRVVVVGMGNSGLDIASELSQKFIAEKLWVSARRGVWVLPEYVNGKVGDTQVVAGLDAAEGGAQAQAALRGQEPRPHGGLRPAQAGSPAVRGASVGERGVPAPGRLRRYRLQARHQPIGRQDGAFRGRHVRGGGCRGVCHRVSHQLPVLHRPGAAADGNNKLPLWRQMALPGVDNLFYLGLAQAMPTLVNFAEQQSKLVAAYLTGNYALPSPADMAADAARVEAERAARYYSSPRHTIQADFDIYVREQKKELADGARRAAAAGNLLPVPGRAAVRV